MPTGREIYLPTLCRTSTSSRLWWHCIDLNPVSEKLQPQAQQANAPEHARQDPH